VSNNQLSNANWWEAETSRRLEVSSIKRARKPKLCYDPTDNETSIAGTSNTKKHKSSSIPRAEVDTNDTVATIAPGPNALEDATNKMATCDSTTDPIIKPASLPLSVADVFDVTMAGDDIADPNHGTQSQSKQVIAPVADVLAGVLTPLSIGVRRSSLILSQITSRSYVTNSTISQCGWLWLFQWVLMQQC